MKEHLGWEILLILILLPIACIALGLLTFLIWPDTGIVQ